MDGRLLALLTLPCACAAAPAFSRRGCLATGGAAVAAATLGGCPAVARGSELSFSSDDGAVQFRLPTTWRIVSSCSPSGRDKCKPPGRRYSVLALRDGVAALEANVDLGAYGKRLSEWQTLDEVASGLLASLPPTTRLAEAKAETNRSGKQARYYLFRFVGANGGERMVKLGVQQSRLYTLTLQCDVAPSDAQRAELEAIASTYQAFPVSSMRGGLLSSTAPAVLRPPSLKLQ